MTTATRSASSPSLDRAHVNWLGVLRSEWTKLWSVRSTYVILALAAIFMIGLSFLIAYGITEAVGDNDFEGPMSQLADTTWLSLQGIGLAQLAIGVLGVLIVTGEYSTGMVRATFTAVPRRIPVLVAKAVLVVAATLVVMIPAAFAAFLLAQGMLAAQNLDAQLSDPGVTRAVIGAALYLAAVGAIGSVLGWLLRSAAGAIFALVAVLILLPILLPLIQLDWIQTFADYLPSTAGQAIYSVGNEAVTLRDIIDPDRPEFGPWEGYAIMVGWAVAGLAIAGWTLLRRDA
jgi:ABC-type transport system involved in multi-copper enzyme maturation permease subunit